MHLEGPTGGESDDFCPPELHVVSGLVDDRRKVLTPDDAVFGLFTWARSVQDGWSLETHGAFWEATLELWPPGRGGQLAREELAWCFRAHLGAGRTPAEAADRMGYPLDSLRRMEVLDTESLLDDAVVADYFLPRVYVPDHDDHPNAGAYPNLSAQRMSQPSARTAALAQSL